MQNIFIGRQAIFNRDMDVYAYELLYREADSPKATVLDGDQASSRVILNSMTEIGLDSLVGPYRAFINLTRNFLLHHPSIPFDKSRVVLEILEEVPVDRPLVEKVANLAAEGYLLALDDYRFEEKWEPLLPYVGIIKVEIPGFDPQSSAPHISELQGRGIRLLAEKVETRESYLQLHALGFDYFQGYYFSRPYTISGRRLPENRLVTLKLIARINDPSVNNREIESLILQDPGLSYKILRYLNSAALALPRRIDAISQAIVYLGLQRIKAWATLIALSNIEDKPQELLNTALLRGHMCSLLLADEPRETQDQGFTAGLLSILDALLDRPLAEILSELPLSQEIDAALLHRQGAPGQALSCILAYENLDWGNVIFPGLNREQIQACYIKASERAFTEQAGLLD